MIHLVALAKLAGKDFAYHYATDDIKQFLEKKTELGNVPDEFLSLFSIHVIKTTSKDFASIQKMDSYFESTTEITSLEEFIDYLRNDSNLTSVDIAGFIEQRYHLSAFPLQKILYYVYSELLIRLKRVPFSANFIAYEKGPVDNYTYRVYKYDNISLARSTEFDKKVFSIKDGNEYIKVINEVVKTYSKYFSDAWNNEAKNLTHRQGTPWSRAHKKGYNEPILDNDILKYHYLETV
ncbi:MAG: Panacea domain-containing protein [Limosilactobacillus sp.]